MNEEVHPKRKIDRAGARERAKERIQAHVGQCEPHIKRAEGYVTEVDCKRCGHAVASLIEVPSTIEKYWQDKHTMVIKKGMILRTLSNHRRIRIDFDDGSHHETEICADCLGALTMDDLECIYCYDLNQFLDDEAQGDAEAPWHVLADRKPTGFSIISE